MDRSQFDNLTRALARRENRGGFVRMFAGGAAAGALAALGVRDARADRTPVTIPGPQPCSRSSCGAGFVCQDGRRLQVDGYCGSVVCPEDASCVCSTPPPGWQGDPNELCQCRCPEHAELIDGVCISVCVPPGQTCSAEKECCRGDKGEPVSCRCSGLFDLENGFRVNCCHEQGGSCSDPTDCCGLLGCLNGACVRVTVDDCFGDGDCKSGETCLNSNEACVASAGQCSD